MAGLLTAFLFLTQAGLQAALPVNGLILRLEHARQLDEVKWYDETAILSVAEKYKLRIWNTERGRVLADPMFTDDFFDLSARFADSFRAADPVQGIDLAAVSEQERSSILQWLLSANLGSRLMEQGLTSKQGRVSLIAEASVQVEIDGTLRRVNLSNAGFMAEDTFPASERLAQGTFLEEARRSDSALKNQWVVHVRPGISGVSRLTLLSQLSEKAREEAKEKAQRFKSMRDKLAEDLVKADKDFFGDWDGRQDIKYSEMTPRMRTLLATKLKVDEKVLLNARITSLGISVMASLTVPGNSGTVSYKIPFGSN